MSKTNIEILVGFFMILGLLALGFLAIKVSGLASYSGAQSYYKVYAEFDNIGSLKVRAPVMVAGVSLGQVNDIQLNPQNYRAHVTLLIHKNSINLPTDTVASIYTQGLLGSNYVNLSPGYADTFLKEGSFIENTQPALILEKLIGQFIYSIQNKK